LRLWWPCFLLEVVFKDDVVVVLLDIVAEVVMFVEEGLQLYTWSVVGQFSGLRLFSLKHSFEEGLSMTPSLHIFMHIEVQNAPRLDFMDRTCAVADEQLFNTGL
jgi:hypothetical protein